ncbi:MAG TPA: RNA polymerase sigma-54 factor, partial [Candidatus Omnitrophota bacterium]|nr:RNA polymerase sigma-54 factor [Candidatus Omnitrophota bacterium]
MALSPRLDIRQTQALVMTPQLQQAIKLLQLSNLELTAFIDQELERNPLLEREDGERPDGAEAPEIELDTRGADEAPMLDAADGGPDASLDVDVDNLYNNDSASDGIDGEAFGQWSRTGGRMDFEDGESNLEQTLTESVSLRDHLTAQLNVDMADPADRMIGLHLIEMLDEAGYLIGDIADVAAALGCAVEQVESVLKRMQRFDPVGIAARSLKECLAVQLIEKD